MSVTTCRYDLRYSYEWFHKHYPNISLVSSESTSCDTQRGENVVNASLNVFDDVFNADCLSKHFCPPNSTQGHPSVIPGHAHSPGSCEQSWTKAYDADGEILPYMGGNLGIWTLFDYLGEPGSNNHVNRSVRWPQVSCNYGSFDYAGFAKPAAFHYRAWWLANVAQVGETAVVSVQHHIVYDCSCSCESSQMLWCWVCLHVIVQNVLFMHGDYGISLLLDAAGVAASHVAENPAPFLIPLDHTHTLTSPFNTLRVAHVFHDSTIHHARPTRLLTSSRSCRTGVNPLRPL